MNILLINHYAGSPELGMEYRPYYLAKEWIKDGHDVTIVAANNSHIRRINPKMATDVEEKYLDGIRYLWINTPSYIGNGIGRINNMLTFIRKLMFKASDIAKKYKPDVVIASSTYPSDNYVARKIAKLSSAKHIYEVHDLWPLSPMELGGMSKYHPFIVAMQHAENFAYRKVDAIVSMLPKTKDYMVSKGLPPDKWYYVPNGFVKEEWDNPTPLNENTKNKLQEIRKSFSTVVGYVGTLGLSNALDLYVDAASNMPDMAFVMVGKGPEKDNLALTIKEKNLKNVFILDAIPKQEVPSLLVMFDILYIGWRESSLYRFGISPNKIFDYMYSGRPIIHVVKAANDPVAEANCGISVNSSDVNEVVESIRKLVSMPQNKLKLMGENGKKYVLDNHDYKVLSQKFIDIMKKI